MNTEKIGKFIKKLRLEKNLSQYKLADMIPIDRTAVSKWERGVTLPEYETLIILCKIFDVSVSEILNGKRNDKNIVTNEISSLEKLTINTINENALIRRRIKKHAILFSMIVFLFIILFLGYYFINSYNSINIYTISANNNVFEINDGLLIVSKQQIYFKLGNINYDSDNINITKITLYNKDSNRLIISSNKEFDTIVEDYGYEEYFDYNTIINDIENFYLKIECDNNRDYIIKLNFVKFFSNDSLFFQRTPKIA